MVKLGTEWRFEKIIEIEYSGKDYSFNVDGEWLKTALRETTSRSLQIMWTIGEEQSWIIVNRYWEDRWWNNF